MEIKKNGAVNPPLVSPPIISVVIATRNRASALEQCLASLVLQDADQHHYEVVVVDNRSRDATCAVVMKRGYRYLYCPKISTSAARNLGAKEARGTWLVFFDDDCVIPPGWMAAALGLIHREPFTIFCGPADSPSGSPYPDWYRGEWESFHPFHRPTVLPDYLYPIECNLMMLRELYLGIGGMNEELGPSQKRFGYHEGAEMINRLRKQSQNSLRIFYHPALGVAHHIQPNKTRLLSRWRRQILAGMDHRNAHPDSQTAPAPSVASLVWRCFYIAGKFTFGPWVRNRAKFSSLRAWFYLKGGREMYRLGESLGPARKNPRKKGSPFFDSHQKLRSKIRMRYMRMIRAIFGYFSLSEIPLRVAESTLETIRHHPAEKGQILWESAGKPVARQPSRVQLPGVHPHLSDTASAPTQNLWMVKLAEAQVVGPSIGVMTQNRTFLGDVSIEFSKPSEDHGMMRRWTLPSARRLPGRSLLLASTGGNTYHHWMMEVMPKLRLLREAGVSVASFDHVLVNGLSRKFQIESLALCGIPPAQCRAFEGRTRYICETLILPSLPGPLGRPLVETCEYLRDLFLQPLPDKKKRRLWIGREKSSSRRIQEADQIEALLSQKGFEKFEADGLSVKSQARAFFEAEWVVAVHGAALTNLVFCRPGTQVVELFSSQYVNPCYRDLCSAAGLKHHAVLSPDHQTGRPLTDLHEAGGGIKIEIRDLENALHSAGLDP